MSYTMHSKVSLDQTKRELRDCMAKWGVENFSISTRNEIVELEYTIHGRPVKLVMGDHEYQKDNMRVLYLAVESMRMNEVRGIDKVLETAYLQLAGPVGERDPYEVLGIVQGTDLSIAEAVYRTMASKYHPDSKPDGNAEKFKEITNAIEKIRKG